MSKVPIIHLNSETLKAGTPSRTAACKDVRKALEEYGCFIAIQDPSPTDQPSNEVFKEVQTLFTVPFETKSQNISNGPFSTYVGSKPSMPLYESLSVTDATDQAAVTKFLNHLWPSGNPNFRETIDFIVKKFSNLDHDVGRMMFESYGVEQYVEDYLGSRFYLLLFTKYSVAEENQLNMGLTPHTDKGFITVLEQNGVSGLEIQTRAGNWIPVDFPPSSRLIIAGDTLKAWSNGRIHPTMHRVKMSEKKERNSLALFSYPTKLVSAPEELIDEEHPRLYKPLDAIGLRAFYHSLDRNQVHLDDVLKAYCGV